MANENTAKVATHVGAHGDHPVGGAVGAAVGAAAGAAAVGAAQGAVLGTVAGPLGMVAGIAIGGVIGALVGKGVAQEVNPTTEDVYWNQNYSTRPYVDQGTSYDTYQPAYHHGINAYSQHKGRAYDEIEPQLRDEWNTKYTGDLPWDKATHASRDAYNRLDTLNDKI